MSFMLTESIVTLVLYCEFLLESFRYGDSYSLKVRSINLLVVLCGVYRIKACECSLASLNQILISS